MNNRNKTQYNFNAVQEVLPPLLRFLVASFVYGSKMKLISKSLMSLFSDFYFDHV